MLIVDLQCLPPQFSANAKTQLLKGGRGYVSLSTDSPISYWQGMSWDGYVAVINPSDPPTAPRVNPI